ncbi:MAG: pyridoxal phosphate-dependent aminotransferase [Candidatus Obscuribacterales bacterium]|nr:pyridoxal phosphate-dependent aminotransferase [Candidatus Obscuribacterales bacterium]
MSTSNRRRHSRRLEGMPESKTGLLLEKATALRESGQAVIDLALGTPDYPPPAFLIEAGQKMIVAGKNGYIGSKGASKLRQAVASQFSAEQSVTVDPDVEVTISAGASAALNATILALLDSGDEAVVFEPFYEYFVPQLALAGALPRFAKLSYGDWRIERKELKKAIGKRCRVILLNSPHNPTGRVFSLEELQIVADLCHKHDLIAVCDEAYAPFVYEGQHKSLCSLPGMKERCVVIRSISKVFNAAGWRVGSIIAPADLTAAIRSVNALSLGAPTPLQEACAIAYEHYAAFCGVHRS